MIRVSGYKPTPGWCCERCVFGRGEHSSWCDSASAKLQRFMAYLELSYETRRLNGDYDDLFRHSRPRSTR